MRGMGLKVIYDIYIYMENHLKTYMLYIYIYICYILYIYIYNIYII